MPSVAATPRKRTALPPNQHQITNFFSPAPTPKLAPEIPGELQSALISVGMRVRSSFALSEYRNAPTLASSSLAAATPAPVAVAEPMTPKKNKSENAFNAPSWTPINKRTRDNFEDVEMTEAAVVQDLETPAQREQARLDMGKKKPLAPRTNVAQKQATLRKGGFWKAVKRAEPVYAKGKVVKDVEMGDSLKTSVVVVDDFEDAGFLMDCA